MNSQSLPQSGDFFWWCVFGLIPLAALGLGGWWAFTGPAGKSPVGKSPGGNAALKAPMASTEKGTAAAEQPAQQTLSQQESTQKQSPQGTNSRQLFQLGVPAPEFSGISAWINSEKLSLADLRGRVVVVNFWSFGCINCQRNLPAYQRWQNNLAQGRDDLILVGIHTPEFAHEKKLQRVKQEVAKAGLTFPIALDNQSQTWKAWKNRYWPTIYLIDRRGRARYAWIGELNANNAGGEPILLEKIKQLLAEKLESSAP